MIEELRCCYHFDVSESLVLDTRLGEALSTWLSRRYRSLRILGYQGKLTLSYQLGFSRRQNFGLQGPQHQRQQLPRLMLSYYHQYLVAFQ